MCIVMHLVYRPILMKLTNAQNNHRIIVAQVELLAYFQPKQTAQKDALVERQFRSPSATRSTSVFNPNDTRGHASPPRSIAIGLSGAN